MAIFKCKMCGGELTLVPGSTVCTCEYCGTKQTVPSADNEKKMTLFARANRILRDCEFDKAAGVFESIVADFPQEAEAYWGLVLCRYGIEYVDDPATGKKVPTCHRSSFESVMDDANYQQAVKNADTVAKEVYRAEGAQIEELRRDIIAVSSREEPYDIFICYKETDENGERTEDSVLAQDAYDALTEKGYRVFFSRITLEDKLGVEFEPHIFAALNSAKIMLAFGTDYERYEAVWVKNEWSRFLQLIAKGEKKTLIPCYKGIKPEDMPKEFTRLQAQDMSKLGAMQDLVRGVEKILPREKKVTSESSGDSVKDAIGDLKNVVYTLIAKFKALPRKKQIPIVAVVAFIIAARLISGVWDTVQSFRGNQYYNNIPSAETQIDRPGIYKEGKANMEAGKYEEAITAFESITDYQDSTKKIEECKAAISQYDEAVSLKNDGKYSEAIDMFSTLNGYKDSAKLIDECVAEKEEILLSSTVTFGAYEQDNNLTNGKEPIEWLVLEKDEEKSKALLLSRYALDYQQYDSAESRSWDESFLNSWLLNDFRNEAFSETEEKELRTDLHYSANNHTTIEEVFLLTSGEAERYFSADKSRQCEATAYAITRGAEADGSTQWWLRMDKSSMVSNVVTKDGTIGVASLQTVQSVRPAIWVNLSVVE